MWFDPLLKFEHKIRKDEIILKDCPFCGNQRYNLEISKTKQFYHCWACGQGGHAKSFLRINKLPVDFDGWLPTITSREVQKKDVVTIEELVPINWVLQGDVLKTKGLEEKDIETYNLLYAPEGKRRNCLIIPLYEGQKLVYTVARHMILGKYINPVIEKRSLIPYYLGKKNRYMLFLCEGALDSIVVNKLGFSSAPLLGTQISDEQIEKIRSFGFTEVVVCLDGDAFDRTLAVYDKLVYRGVPSHIIRFDDGDEPNDMYCRDNGKELIKKLTTYHNPDLLERLSANSGL